MTGDLAPLVGQIRSRAAGVVSFAARYRATSRLAATPLEANGTVRFLAPDRFRAEAAINGRQILTVRNGSTVHRHILSRHEIWTYDLAVLPETLPINAGVADLRDPFLAAEERSLEYEGDAELDGRTVHAFVADARNWAQEGLLDTRKGFSIRFRPKGLEARIRLLVDQETGLLRSITGRSLRGEELFQTEYVLESVNGFLDEGLFALDRGTGAYRVLDLTDTLRASLDPTAAEGPPSPN
jgi:outer membrane lipoprotein-sorting protein